MELRYIGAQKSPQERLCVEGSSRGVRIPGREEAKNVEGGMKGSASRSDVGRVSNSVEQVRVEDLMGALPISMSGGLQLPTLEGKLLSREAVK